jgi:hypothetical protein
MRRWNEGALDSINKAEKSFPSCFVLFSLLEGDEENSKEKRKKVSFFPSHLVPCKPQPQ